MRPTFSVIIPTRNRAQFLSSALDSVVAQDRDDWEVLVVDDGGTDATEKVVLWKADPRIRYVWKCNQERSIARNFGIDLTTGAYLIFLDSDDQLLPDCFAQIAKIIHNNRLPAAVCTGHQFIDLDSKKTQKVAVPSHIFSALQRKNPLAICSMAIRRDILEEIRFVDSEKATISEDWCLWLRIACRFEIVVGTAVTSVVHEHGDRSLRSIDPDSFRDAVLVTCDSWRSDPAVEEKMGANALSRLVAFMLMTIGQHYLIGERVNKRAAFKWLVRSAAENPIVLASRIGLACAKKLLLPRL